ncbi:hypothetical protein HK100_006300 [Physocladia obscura]|uniref:Autophagy-related protein 14 n=1 Tax=Physocladia obscura TaxID=109957 RepID=A0AAD5XBF1_9FUNG|nr:hypothetical protein HK100_006300 [Physocladia obscura]
MELHRSVCVCRGCGVSDAARAFVCSGCVYSSISATSSVTRALAAEAAVLETNISWKETSRSPIVLSLARRKADLLKLACTSLELKNDEDREKLLILKRRIADRKDALARATQAVIPRFATDESAKEHELEKSRAKYFKIAEALRRVQRSTTNSNIPAAIFGNISPQELSKPAAVLQQGTPAHQLALNEKYQFLLESTNLGKFSNPQTAISLFYETPLEFRFVNVGFSGFGNYYLYGREKFNAALGYAIHMTIIMCQYLGVSWLPFQLICAGSQSHAKAGALDMRGLVHEAMGTEDESDVDFKNMPLFLTETNLNTFTIGLAMLNYDIVYLCWTQGVSIPLHQAANTLENLAACCRAQKLGRDCTAPCWMFEKLTGNLPSTKQINEPETMFTLIKFRKLWLLQKALQKRTKPTPTTSIVISPKIKSMETRRGSAISNISQLSQQQPPHRPSLSSLQEAVSWATLNFTNKAVKIAAATVNAAAAAAIVATSPQLKSSDAFVFSDENDFKEEHEEIDDIGSGDAAVVVSGSSSRLKIDSGLLELAAVLEVSEGDEDSDLANGDAFEWMLL